MTTRPTQLVLALLITAAAARAQSPSYTGDVRRDYQSIRDYFIRAAEKMPEEKYAFKPSPDVRSFAQQIAHVADDQYNLCAPAKGETRTDPYTFIEGRFSKKSELVVELQKAFAYCDAAYANVTDVTGLQPSFPDKGRSKFGMLNWNLWHTWEHYGNIVVYLRMNGLVPPTSEPRAPMKMP